MEFWKSLVRFAAIGVLAWVPAASGQAIDPKMKVEKIYETYCSACHGKNFEGGLGGSLVDGIWKHGSSDADITKSIAKGNVPLGMTPWEGTLSPEQIRAMVVYLREQEKQERYRKTEFPKPLAGKVTKTQHLSYKLEVVVDSGLDIPWGIGFLPDGRMLVTERPGPVRLVNADGTLDPEPIRGTPAVVHHGQGGMMEAIPHPDYAKNGWIYLAFADGNGSGKGTKTITAVVRGKLKGHDWVGQEWIWKTDEKFYTGAGVHFGTRLVFDKGYLYFVVGERGGMMQAQDLTFPNGKIYRIHDDGRIPNDNPFNNRPGAIPGIWSYGHRNPQGLVMDPRNGDLYSTEHGPRGGDEFNLIKKGANYGWPVITYGMNYNGTPMTDKTAAPGMEQPVIHWTPSIAACGLAVVTGDKFPGWRHDFLAGGLASQEIRRLRVVNQQVVEQEVIFKDAGRVRDVKCGPDGFIYIALNGPDQIVRLVPGGG